jgi:transcriptional regulator with XRE-family HTH domain
MESTGMKVAFASVVGAVIAEERERRGASQLVAAKDAGLAQSTWARMELGRACTLENLAKASALLNIELWELVRFAEERASRLKGQGIEVVYELPSEEEMKAEAQAWLTGSATIAGISMLGVAGPIGWALMGGVAAFSAFRAWKARD